jgi:hypothetical protein
VEDFDSLRLRSSKINHALSIIWTILAIVKQNNTKPCATRLSAGMRLFVYRKKAGHHSKEMALLPLLMAEHSERSPSRTFPNDLLAGRTSNADLCRVRKTP